MPRLNIIILEQLSPSVYRYALWAAVPSARQPFYAIDQAAFVSQWADALPGDTANFQNGSVTEKIETIQVPQGTTTPQVKAFLQDRWTDWQTAVTARNDWPFYGTTWDGSTWTAGGVA
jgi:hypothetical protein